MRCISFAAIVGCVLLSTIQLQTEARVYSHCELAQELRRLQIPESQIATWVCIAHYESRLNTSATSGTGDHGIFQISEEYWCSPPGRGKGCGLSCADLEDDNIADDVECVQTIFEEHQGLSGNGFTAWAVYPRCKKSSNANRFIKKCTAGSIDNSIDSTDAPIDLRLSSPTYSSAPRNSYFSRPSYRPSHDLSYTKSSVSPFSPDYSYKSVYSSGQDISSTRASADPFYQGYDYAGRYDPFDPKLHRSSIPSTPSPAVVLAYNPSIYSSANPSSYSIGSIYYNPFERSTAAPPAVYSFSPRKTFSTSSFDSSRTVSSFHSSLAPKVYKAYTESDAAAVIKTSSPAPFRFKAPWEDFPWWNGGK